MGPDHSPTYAVRLVFASGEEFGICRDEPSPLRAHRIAIAALHRTRRRRTIIVSRDGRDLPGGAWGLSDLAYQAWLEEHAPEESPT